MDYVVETNNLTKYYGTSQALANCSLRVPKGSIFGLIGRNGAGKTTMFRLLCGLQRPTAGTYELFGERGGTPSCARARRRMGALLETPSVIGELSARENIRAREVLLGVAGKGQIPDPLKLVNLTDTGTKKAKRFSLGMRQRLGLAVALVGSPDLLILDEPANGLDPQGIIELRGLIHTLNREQGITVLISSHILDELSRLATDYCFIDSGRILEQISADDLMQRCRRALVVEVSDTNLLAAALDEMGYEYDVESSSGARIFGNPEITPFVVSLAEAGVTVRHVREEQETLESYYTQLIGRGGAVS